MAAAIARCQAGEWNRMTPLPVGNWDQMGAVAGRVEQGCACGWSRAGGAMRVERSIMDAVHVWDIRREGDMGARACMACVARAVDVVGKRHACARASVVLTEYLRCIW